LKDELIVGKEDMGSLIAIIMCLVGYWAVYAACTLQKHPDADPNTPVASIIQRIGIMAFGTCLLIFCSKILPFLAIITFLVGIILVVWGFKGRTTEEISNEGNIMETYDLLGSFLSIFAGLAIIIVLGV
jgi:Ca2+/Na+ antiporter